MTTFITNLSSLALLTFSLSAGAQTDNQNLKDLNTAYQIEIVNGVPLSKRALLGGTVISSIQVSLSTHISGDVLSVNGKEGGVFKQGAVIATLEQTIIQAKKDSAVAEIASAAEVFNNARVQYEKSIVSPYSNDMFSGAFSWFTEPMSNFSGRSNPSFNKYANRASYYSGLQQAKNKLKQAQLSLKQIEEQLEDANITAPFDGVIVAKSVNQGDVVHSGQVLIQFADIKNLQVEVNVPSRLIRSLKLNKKYRIKLDIANVVVGAKLSQIYPIADNNKHSIKVKFDLPPDIPVLVGAYAEVEIFEQNSTALTPVIPQDAIIWRSSLPSVFVINSQTNLTELRFIRLGEQIGKGEKSVLSGLKVGERIVANPNILMISGMKI